MKKYVTCATTLFAATLLFAQSVHAPFLKVYVGTDGLAHIVDDVGKDISFPKEQGQVAVESPQLSPDKQAAGWLTDENNCCTSYPISTGLLIYSNGRKHWLGTGQMIYDWCFIKDGREVVLSAGPVHNPDGQDLRRYDTKSGKQLQEWHGDLNAARPDWAACIAQP